jgi:molecular chaperone GrpE
MSKKKKDRAEEQFPAEENAKNGNHGEERLHDETDSGVPAGDKNAILEGEIVPELEASMNDNSIPVEEKLELIRAALEASEAKATEYLDGWQRSMAEFTNFRKRQERERELARFETVGRIAKRYLPVVDDLERALNERPTSGEGAAWSEGIELIYRKLMNILDAEGVTLIDAQNQMFDPNLHEAVVQTESDEHESGQIIEVLQPGYKMGERVLRPAMVRIAA